MIFSKYCDKLDAVDSRCLYLSGTLYHALLMIFIDNERNREELEELENVKTQGSVMPKRVNGR